MRITESQLRRIVREMLEEEGPASISDDEGTLVGEADDATVSREYKGKEYRASHGSASALRKAGGSKKRAVDTGAFDWATNPYAAATAAQIATTGKPLSK